MTTAWRIASDNFRDDDGSLPTVEFADLRPESVARIYQFVCTHGVRVSESVTVWDSIDELEVPLHSVEDPCDWLQQQRIGPFHCCFGDISMDDTILPIVGVFVFPNVVEIDFKMGAHWNPANVDAFFSLLAEFKRLAPEAKIRSAKNEGLMDEISFLEALRLYLAEGKDT